MIDNKLYYRPTYVFFDIDTKERIEFLEAGEHYIIMPNQFLVPMDHNEDTTIQDHFLYVFVRKANPSQISELQSLKR